MAEKIKIVTDSTTSLSLEECKKIDVICLETSYTVNSITHNEFDDPATSLLEFYNILEQSKKCSTGCITTNTFEECFEQIISDGFKVIYLGLSASLSSTFSNSELAAKNINEKHGEKLVAVVDTRSASYGSLILIERIKDLINENKTLAEIEQIVSDDAKKMSVAFVSPDLTFMFNCGRLSALELGIGKIFRIVPIIFVSETGKLKARDKCIGMKLAFKKLKTDFVDLINKKKHKKCYITRCDMPAEVETIKNYIAENTEIELADIKTGLIDKTLSCCCGPKTVAIFCL